MEKLRGDCLSPERVIRILDKHGTKVSLAEAKLIIGYMSKLVQLAINDHVRKGKSLLKSESEKEAR